MFLPSRPSSRVLLRCVLHECGELGLVLHQLRLAQAVRQEPVRVVQLGQVRLGQKLAAEQERVQPECMLLGPEELKPGLVRLGLLLEPEAELQGQKPVADLQVLKPESRVA